MPRDAHPFPRRAALLAAAALLLAACLSVRPAPPPPAPSAPDGWQVPDLLAHLGSRGLRLHAVAASRSTGELSQGAYRCEGERAWEDVAGLPTGAAHAGRWRGVALVTGACGPFAAPPEEAAGWGENGLQAGPFVFFGDAALLRRVAAALSE
jgi:hypothetical protein